MIGWFGHKRLLGLKVIGGTIMCGRRQSFLSSRTRNIRRFAREASVEVDAGSARIEDKFQMTSVTPETVAGATRATG
jgi:hypothetical protein